MNIRLTLLSLMACCGLLAGCGTTDDEEQKDVSTLPWNKPQKWEKSGAIGSTGVGY